MLHFFGLLLVLFFAADVARAETPCEARVNEVLLFMRQPVLSATAYTLPPVATHEGYGRLADGGRKLIAANLRIARAGVAQTLREIPPAEVEEIRAVILKAHDGVVSADAFDLHEYVLRAPTHALREIADLIRLKPGTSDNRVSNETYDAIHTLETYQGPKIRSRLRSDVTLELRSYPMLTVTGPWTARAWSWGRTEFGEISFRATIDLQTCGFVSEKGTRHETLRETIEADYSCRWPNFRSGYPKGCRALQE